MHHAHWEEHRPPATSVVSLLGGILELQFLRGPGLERGLTGNRGGLQTHSRNECVRWRKEQGIEFKPPFLQQSLSSSHPAALGMAVAAALYIIYIGAKDGTQDFTSMRQAFCP